MPYPNPYAPQQQNYGNPYGQFQSGFSNPYATGGGGNQGGGFSLGTYSPGGQLLSSTNFGGFGQQTFPGGFGGGFGQQGPLGGGFGFGQQGPPMGGFGQQSYPGGGFSFSPPQLGQFGSQFGYGQQGLQGPFAPSSYRGGPYGQSGYGGNWGMMESPTGSGGFGVPGYGATPGYTYNAGWMEPVGGGYGLGPMGGSMGYGSFADAPLAKFMGLPSNYQFPYDAPSGPLIPQ